MAKRNKVIKKQDQVKGKSLTLDRDFSQLGHDEQRELHKHLGHVRASIDGARSKLKHCAILQGTTNVNFIKSIPSIEKFISECERELAVAREHIQKLSA